MQVQKKHEPESLAQKIVPNYVMGLSPFNDRLPVANYLLETGLILAASTLSTLSPLFKFMDSFPVMYCGKGHHTKQLG